MVVLQAGFILDASSTLVLVAFVGLYAVSRVFETDWWEEFWLRVSQRFDRLRAIHWLLPAIVVAVGLTIYDVAAAELDAGLATLLLWIVLAGYASWLFITRHLFARLHRRSLRQTSTDADQSDSEGESGEGIPSSGRLR